MTAVVLGPMSRRRFGQNERSAFGFLASAEPGGFQEFLASRPATAVRLFGPERFWDYLRINLEPAILASQRQPPLGARRRRHRALRGARDAASCHDSLRRSPSSTCSGMAPASPLTGAHASCLRPDARKAQQVDAALADLERWSVAVFRKHPTPGRLRR